MQDIKNHVQICNFIDSLDLFHHCCYGCIVHSRHCRNNQGQLCENNCRFCCYWNCGICYSHIHALYSAILHFAICRSYGQPNRAVEKINLITIRIHPTFFVLCCFIVCIQSDYFIMNLPIEIIDRILSYVDDPYTLTTCTKTNSVIRSLSYAPKEKLLYRLHPEIWILLRCFNANKNTFANCSILQEPDPIYRSLRQYLGIPKQHKAYMVEVSSLCFRPHYPNFLI
jgi:hypothetical protein